MAMTNRRDFLRLSAIAAAGLGGSPSLATGADATERVPPTLADATERVPPAFKQPSGTAAVMFSVLPYIQLLGADSVGIVWMTAVKATGRVTWSQDGWATEHAAVTEEDGLLDANSFMHKVVVKGVDLHRPLQYRVHSRRIGKFDIYGIGYAGDEVSYESSMDAPLPPDGILTWAMFNDVHNLRKVYDIFLPHLADVHTMCIFNGDVMEDLTYEEKFKRDFLAPFARVTQEARLPVWFVRGNHETRGQLARQLRDYVALQDNRYYGAVTLEGVRFVFVDTGEDKVDSTPVYQGVNDFDGYLAREIEWVKREVASREWKSARARIVVQHIPPPLSKGGWEPKLKRLDALNEVWKTANVTLMMGAHLHWWCWMDPWPGRPYPLVVGGGPRLGNSGKRDNATLTKCRLEGNRLLVKMLDQTGKTIIEKGIALSRTP